MILYGIIESEIFFIVLFKDHLRIGVWSLITVIPNQEDPFREKCPSAPKWAEVARARGLRKRWYTPGTPLNLR